MENYLKKAADAFLVERPYGMRVDYRKKGFVLFNRNLNVLGNVEHARLEELPLERFNVEEIPLEGEIVEEHAGFTDVDPTIESNIFTRSKELKNIYRTDTRRNKLLEFNLLTR